MSCKARRYCSRAWDPVKPRERLRVDSASESRRRCLRPSWTSSPVSSAMTVPRFEVVSELLLNLGERSLRETVDGLGRSMCSHRRRYGICVSHSALHCKARGVCVLETTCCEISTLMVSFPRRGSMLYFHFRKSSCIGEWM